MIRIVVLAFACAMLFACSSAAEFERPEDTSVVRASYTSASGLLSGITGGTDVCQLTILDKTVANNGGSIALVEDYEVRLTEDGCEIQLRELEPP